MKKILLTIIILSGLFLAGCNNVKNENLFITLDINYDLEVNAGERLAITEIEEKVTRAVLVDYNSINKSDIINLCKCILAKWKVDDKLNVEIYNNKLLITIGSEEQRFVKTSKIMLPL